MDLVVHHHGRGARAAAEALGLLQGEKPVRRRLPHVDAELLSEYLQEVRRADHPADRGHADPDDVPAAGLQAEKGVVACHASQLGLCQGEAAPDLVELVGGNVVAPGIVLCCMESREKLFA